MIDVQHIAAPPANFHYCWNRGTDPEGETTAKDYLTRQGCTLVMHCEDGMSYGVVEPCAVVHQRAREPRYD